MAGLGCGPGDSQCHQEMSRDPRQPWQSLRDLRAECRVSWCRRSLLGPGGPMGRPCRRLGWRGLGTTARAPYEAAAWAASSFFLMSTFLSKETAVPRARVPAHSDFLSPCVGVPSLSFSQEGHQGHSVPPVPLLEQKWLGQVLGSQQGAVHSSAWPLPTGWVPMGRTYLTVKWGDTLYLPGSL